VTSARVLHQHAQKRRREHSLPGERGRNWKEGSREEVPIRGEKALVVNANSAYNILLDRPALNRIRVVASTRHMKMKLPDLSGRVIVIKSDQQEAKKC